MDLASYEDKELLLSRSQELQWVDDVTDFQCVRCNKVLIRHYIANCGHKFCLNCKKLVGDGSKRWRCPLKECNKFIEDIHLQDVFFEETVFELRTHCPNHKYGCPIIGPLKDIESHLRKCQDTREKALPVILDQSKSLDSAFVIKHIEKINEKMERMSSTLSEMQKSMREERLAQETKWAEMGKKSKEVDRKWEEMNKRVNEMSAKTISNTNEETKKMVKENAEEILKLKGKSENWLEMLDFKEKKHNEKINQLETEMKKISNQYREEISILKKKLSELNGRDEALEKSISLLKPHINLRNSDGYFKNEADFTWIINDIKTKVKRADFSLHSPIFSLKGYPFGARATLTLKSDNLIYITLSYKDISDSGKKLDLKLIPAVNYTFKDQSSTAKIISREHNYAFKSVMQYDVMYYERSIIESNKLVSDTISIDIHVESPEVAKRGYSYDGSITWAIDDYREKREMVKDNLASCYPSPSFYTSPKGYKVRAKMWLNGWSDYKGKGLSVEIDFQTGPYDAQLIRSFKHKTTVTLFHPADFTKHLVKSVEQNIDKQKWYRINMGSQEEIEKLLDNDTLYYQVNVVPA